MIRPIKLILLDNEYSKNGYLFIRDTQEFIGRGKLETRAAICKDLYALINPKYSKLNIGDFAYHKNFGLGYITKEQGVVCFYSPHKSGGSITTPLRNLRILQKVIATSNIDLNQNYRRIAYKLGRNDVFNLPSLLHSIDVKSFLNTGLSDIFVDITEDGKPLIENQYIKLISKHNIKRNYSKEDYLRVITELYESFEEQYKDDTEYVGVSQFYTELMKRLV